MANWTIERRGSSEPVTSEDVLRDLLGQLSEEGDSSLVLSHDSGNTLLVDVHGPLAHVQFKPASNNEPMLVASLVPAELVSRTEYVNFKVGKVPTRILRDFCLPAQTMKRIVVHYYTHLTLPDWVKWIRLDWP